MNPHDEKLRGLSEACEKSFDQLKRIMAARERRLGGMKRRKRNALLRSVAVEVGELAPGIEYWIVESPVSLDVKRMRANEAAGKLPAGFCASMTFVMSMEGALNGYVAFPKRRAPLRARTFGADFLAYLPVHGGVTYAVKDGTACVYGFDTGHINSDPMPRTERPWIAWQCRVLYESILQAAKIERAYLRAQTNAERAALLQPLVDFVPEETLGTGALLNILSGQL